MIRPDLVQYLRYVRNTGGNCTIENFDDDWEPIGPRVRDELMPVYVVLRNGRLTLTKLGEEEIDGG